MALALQAINYMILLQLGIFALFLGVGYYEDFAGPETRIVFSLVSVVILLVARLAVRRRWGWVLAPFAVVCIYNFFSAMAGGIEVLNFPYLANAILSGVALVGLNDWRNDRKRSLAVADDA